MKTRKLSRLAPALSALALCASAPVLAQAPGFKDAPPPPVVAEDPAAQPQVTIKKRGKDTVEEYRVNGRLYMMKVVPPEGPAYFLIDERGDGQFTRRDSLDSGIRPPSWVIFQW